jgi:hypothetical protein
MMANDKKSISQVPICYSMMCNQLHLHWPLTTISCSLSRQHRAVLSPVLLDAYDMHVAIVTKLAVHAVLDFSSITYK